MTASVSFWPKSTQRDERSKGQRLLYEFSHGEDRWSGAGVRREGRGRGRGVQVDPIPMNGVQRCVVCTQERLRGLLHLHQHHAADLLGLEALHRPEREGGKDARVIRVSTISMLRRVDRTGKVYSWIAFLFVCVCVPLVCDLQDGLVTRPRHHLEGPQLHVRLGRESKRLYQYEEKSGAEHNRHNYFQIKGS
jgi:hypothetical protein